METLLVVWTYRFSIALFQVTGLPNKIFGKRNKRCAADFIHRTIYFPLFDILFDLRTMEPFTLHDAKVEFL